MSFRNIFWAGIPSEKLRLKMTVPLKIILTMFDSRIQDIPISIPALKMKVFLELP